MINPQIKKITTFLLIIARVDRVAQVLARSACRPLGIDLAVKEHLSVIVMGLQPSSNAFAEILVQGSIVVEA